MGSLKGFRLIIIQGKTLETGRFQVADPADEALIEHCQALIKRTGHLAQLYSTGSARLGATPTEKLIHQMPDSLREIESAFVGFLDVVRFVYQIESIEDSSSDSYSSPELPDESDGDLED